MRREESFPGCPQSGVYSVGGIAVTSPTHGPVGHPWWADAGRRGGNVAGPQIRVHGPYTRSDGNRIGAALAGGLCGSNLANEWLAVLNQSACVVLMSVLKWAREHRAHPSLCLQLHRPSDLLFRGKKVRRTTRAPFSVSHISGEIRGRRRWGRDDRE